MSDTFMMPAMPSKSKTKQNGIISNMFPVLSTAILINSPIAREPASPINSLLGSAFSQRYGKRDKHMMAIISRMFVCVCSRNIEIPMETMDRMDSVPLKPSIPSVQLVALMDTQTRIT